MFRYISLTSSTVDSGVLAGDVVGETDDDEAEGVDSCNPVFCCDVVEETDDDETGRVDSCM